MVVDGGVAPAARGPPPPSSASVGATTPSNKPQRTPQQQQQGRRFAGVKVGLSLHCLDSFQSKYTGEKLLKWRESQVRVFDGIDKTSKICVRFTGWSAKYDRWLDLNKEEDLLRLAPLNLLSPEQIEYGEPLDDYQSGVAFAFLQTGEMPSADDISTLHERRRSSSPVQSPDYMAYKVGQKVDVQDVLYKGAETSTSKWRAAEIIDLAGSKMRVHFIGWDDSWDEVIDLSKDANRVGKYGSMTSLQGRPSVLQKTNSEGGAAAVRRAQRRSFDGNMTTYSTAKKANENETLQQFEEKSLLWEDEQISPAVDGKVAHAKNRQRFAQDFAPQSKPPLNRRHSTSGLESGSSRKVSSENAFCDRMEAIGLHVVEVEPDGNCLFRAIAHQFYLDSEKHAELRAACVQHMAKNRERFEVFCTTNFDHHLRRMAMDGTWAAELEVRAMEEIYDRVFSIYSSDSKEAKPLPLNTNFDERQLLGVDVETVKLSYHGNHYNSIFDVKYALPLTVRKTKLLEESRKALFYGRA